MNMFMLISEDCYGDVGCSDLEREIEVQRSDHNCYEMGVAH